MQYNGETECVSMHSLLIVNVRFNGRKKYLKNKYMEKQVIKENRKGILHFPRFVKNKNEYVQDIVLCESMFRTDDSCDSGLAKIWGIALGHIHWNNSYRFAYRIIDGVMHVHYYAYIGGVSPQDNTNYKSDTFIENIEPYDTLRMKIKFDIINKVRMEVHHIKPETVFDRFNSNNVVGVSNLYLPAPKGFRWPLTECYPSVKCRHDFPINYIFI